MDIKISNTSLVTRKIFVINPIIYNKKKNTPKIIKNKFILLLFLSFFLSYFSSLIIYLNEIKWQKGLRKRINGKQKNSKEGMINILEENIEKIK
jgi:cellulose synthase/poly-beta-1,6-N-acetylglucosamine synthase-like glycosyltransferase